MEVVDFSSKQSYTVSNIDFTYSELKKVYKALKKYPKPIRREIIEESTKLNGFNPFEQFIEEERKWKEQQYKELQKGYMKLLGGVKNN